MHRRMGSYSTHQGKLGIRVTFHTVEVECKALSSWEDLSKYQNEFCCLFIEDRVRAENREDVLL